MSDRGNTDGLVGTWVGHVLGTDPGPVFAESILDSNGCLILDMRLRTGGGIIKISAVTTRDAPYTARLVISNFQENDTSAKTSGILHLTTVTSQTINGHWESEEGGKGTLALSRQVLSGAGQPSNEQQPLELHRKEESFPSVVLAKKDIISIIEYLVRRVGTKSPVVLTLPLHGKDTSFFSENLLKRSDLPRSVSHLHMQVSDNRQPLSNIISITLSSRQGCSFSVQSADGTWVSGVHVELQELFRPHINPLRAFYQKRGLDFNGFMFLVAIAFIPDLEWYWRLAFLLSVVVIALGFKLLHTQLTRTTVYLDNTEPSSLRKILPSVFSSILAAGAVALIGWMSEIISELVQRFF